MIKNFRDKFLNIKEGIKGNIQDTFGTRIIEKILQDGSVYEGEISVSGVKVGQGIMIFPKGDVYMGSWREDKFNGEGVYVFSNGERYEGNLVNNQKQGKGTFYYLNGDIYIGDWIQNKKSGSGILQRQGGEKYEG